MYDVLIRHEGGRRSKVDCHVEDLGEACAFVLRLADQLGEEPNEGDDAPKWVEIYRGDRLEISVSVVRGGLVGRTIGKVSRSM